MKLESGISAVVTGGASGLGAGTARALASRGVKVGIIDLNEAAGAALASDIGGMFVKCDVTRQDDVAQALSALRSKNGQERILVNCAGIAMGQRTVRRERGGGAIVQHDIAAFRKVIEVNLIGTFIMIAASAAGMMTAPPLEPDGERGVIVTTASVAAEDGQIGQVAYAASKGGVAAMTLPIARDLSRDGIRVATILFLTPMFDTLPEEARASLAASVPFPQRLGSPDEYAALAAHICENVMLNGVRIRLDGALRMGPR